MTRAKSSTRKPTLVHPYTAGHENVRHIAALVCEARPQWDPGLVQVVLLSHVGQVDGSDLAVAAIRAACNPDLPTPKAIGWRGPHWDGLATTPPHVTTGPRCSVCGKVEPRCYGERPGPDDHAFDPVRT